ncbi:MAG: ATP-grasp domain-containing protein [Candidatus Eisenbacteria bacterium]|uniref:ATP-grasp domain-containing protein n=1 Tax=Eiseniibacteriota bacterium TaxID=2212470 RepID=A0A948RXT2_UNCEI|nr:ATP-grasp domain-containing protein [Candidatus Eisenbacteria bacterium]MBU1951138.1 ATP-grasp domain-containing protein [Candidatus Eisenbacteria bacterium]MBU2693005.1 ATP-grasp domain-containing protein [Candidatus Eisenbacteria bacterium]
MPKKVLVANRGEIAVRILRGIKEMGWTGVAVYSEADRGSLHVRLADEAYLIGAPAPVDSYLNIESLLETARKSRAGYLHPGYGFLAENAGFAEAVTRAGLRFIGPSAEAIASMGNKVEAREMAIKAGVPVTPGTDALPMTGPKALKEAHRLGYPILVKAAFGGGGRGMRVCRSDEDLDSAIETAHSEAERAFGDGTLFLEKWLETSRHIEVQIMADDHGHVVAMGERECSIQRRHQKLIEETPSMAVNETLRTQMMEAAVKLAKAIGYSGAGTVEFLLDSDGSFYFLEMNTRLQVEHPVTEMVTGFDLVKAQLIAAEGKKLPWGQKDIRPRGHAIEARICAEDPFRDFAPQAGFLSHLRLSSGPGLRNDMGFTSFSEVPIYYDSLMGKVIAWGCDREEARIRLLRALGEMIVAGVLTNIPFHKWCLSHRRFIAGDLSTRFVDEEYKPELFEDTKDETSLAIAAVLAAEKERYLTFSTSHPVSHPPSPWALASRPGRGEA